MAKVFLHHKKDDKGQWINEEREFARIPCVGEHVALDMSSPYYRVFAVVHCPFETSSFDAEVYLHRPEKSVDVIGSGHG